MLRITTLVLVAVFSTSAMAAPLYDVTGKQYSEWSKNTRQIYVAGLLGGIQVGGLRKKDSGKLSFADPIGKTVAQCAQKAEVIEFSQALDDYIAKKTRKGRETAATVLFMELMIDRCIENA